MACDYDHGINFTNNSPHDVYVYLGIVGRDLGGSLYPDTAVSRVRAGVLFKQGESKHFTYSRKKNDPWVGTLSLFIFDADTFNTYSWEEIQDGYKISQRYDLTREDLRMLNRKITYPPDERMRGMKMYPPFGQ